MTWFEMIRECYGKRAIPILAIMGLFVTFPVAGGTAEANDAGRNVMIDLDVSAGYNDNPREIVEREGSFFAAYGVTLSGTTDLGSGRFLSGSISGTLTEYEEGEFAQDLSAKVSLGQEPGKSLLQKALFVELLVKRDDLYPEGDRFVLGGGGSFEWFPSALWSIRVEPAIEWQHFDEPQRIPTNLMGGQMRPPPGAGGPLPPFFRTLTDEERNDTLGRVELDVSRAMSPSVSVSLLGGFARRWSTLETEQAWEYWGGAGFSWVPVESIAVGAQAQVMGISFDEAPDGANRTDDVLQAAAGISWVHGAMTIYGRVEYVDYDSTFESERYRKTVTRCGLGYSF